MAQLSSSYRLRGGLVFILLSLIAAASMYLRFQAELLWGWRPLVLFLGLFIGWQLILSRRPSRMTPSDDKNRVLALLGGLLLGLGYPGYLPYPILLFVAWVPLLLLQRRLAQQEASGLRVFGFGYAAFLLFNIISTWWVSNTGLVAGLFPVLVNPLLMALPWLLFDRVSRRLPKVSGLAFIAPWLTFEYLHYRWDLSWPWLDMGNGLAQNPWMAQWYEYTGTGGGSLWILLFNYLLFTVLYSNRDAAKLQPAAVPQRIKPVWSKVGLFALFVLPQVVSLLIYRSVDTQSGTSVSVVAVNLNAEPHFEKFGAGSQRAAVDTAGFLMGRALAESEDVIDYFLLPETSFGRIRENRPLEEGSFSRLLNLLPTDKFQYLFTGFSGFYEFRPDEFVTPAVRYSGDRAYEALNAAIQIGTYDLRPQTYRKGVFVPGAESLPFSKALGFLRPILESTAISLGGFGTQEERNSLEGVARIAPVICYEGVFGEYFTDYITEGEAQAAFIMTNDGWWDNTPGHKQHLWIHSLRAIETRRAMARAANLGHCAFINARGDVTSRTEYNKMGYLKGEVQLREEITWYVKRGDQIGRVAGLLTIMLVLSWLAKMVRGRNM
ncbi:MAG: apolipoprotein N-acyltransferase [Bacteroidota bacterium]